MNSSSSAAWGKKPLSDNTADRIQQQTLANMKTLYEGKVKVAEEETERLREQRKLEAKEAEELFDALLGKVDLLVNFLVEHHAHELPDEILELIAGRQEARIESSLATDIDLSDIDANVRLLLVNGGIGCPMIGEDGQVLRRTSGTVGWADPNLVTPKSLERVKEKVRSLVTRLKE